MHFHLRARVTFDRFDEVSRLMVFENFSKRVLWTDKIAVPAMCGVFFVVE